MKRFCILLSVVFFTCLVCASSLSEEEFNVFIGVKWGDSVEKVQSVLGTGEINDSFGPVILRYRNIKFVSNKGQAILTFDDTGLYMISISIVDLTSDVDIQKSYVDAFSAEYGTPIRTDDGYMDYNGVIKEKADGEFYYWKPDEHTGIFIRNGSSLTADMTFVSIKNKAVQGKNEFQVGKVTSSDEFNYGSDGKEVKINAFIGVSTDIVIPDSIDGIPVTMIGEKAFADNKNIHSVYIPESIKLIEQEAFYKCENLETVCIPSSVTELPDGCFLLCNKLKNVYGLENVYVVGTYCFQYCDSFTDELIFAHDITLRWGAFEDSGIMGISFFSGKADVEMNVFGDSEIRYCYIDKKCNFSFVPYDITIEYGQFHQCENLKTVIIPKTVQKIPENVFKGCRYVTVYTPEKSPADKYARERFISVNNSEYEQKVKEYAKDEKWTID